MPSPHSRLEGFADGGRNGTGGSASAPLLDSNVCSSPSLPTAYTGSTPPKPIGATARPPAAPGAPGVPGAPDVPGAPVAPGDHGAPVAPGRATSTGPTSNVCRTQPS